MSNDEVMALCRTLMTSDTESDVVGALKSAGLWDDDRNWRWLGDEEFNYSSVGNQQSRAEQAIVEKLVNSVDAKLIAAARLAGDLPSKGSEPQGPNTPGSITSARELYFGEALKDMERLSRSITVSATGWRPREGSGRPCFTIVDDGEGQTPSRMPATILSLHKGNKDKIKFAQGKFNMGGTGVLEFCGVERNLQFVLSRRHPKLLSHDEIETTEADWSFTVIRREDPVEGKSSRFTYLAPLGAEKQPRDGALLHFSAPSLPIFPDKNKAYERTSEWGTLIKLYEYDARRFGTNMMLDDGLMFRARLMLPQPALPIRFHECRGYRGHSGSFDTSMPGLIETLHRDLEDDKRDNVEWYDKLAFDVDGEAFTASVYLFKNKSTADNYKKDEGVIFTYNGQCHATMTKDFFRRKRVKQDYLWHSLIVFVDCSAISVRAHEKLFMNSRDRLRDGELRAKLEQQLEDQLGNNHELRELASERRKKELAAQPKASESVAKIIENLISKNPTLAALLGYGTRISNPHRPEATGSAVAGFIGKRFPTYFRFKGHEAGFQLNRDAHQNSFVRVSFETDGANDYFKRDDQPGTFSLYRITASGRELAQNFHRPRPVGGNATLTLSLPNEASIGDLLTFEAEITDPSRIDAFTNRFTLRVQPEQPNRSGTPVEREHQGKEKGDGKGRDGQGNQTTGPSQLDIPQPVWITEDLWAAQEPAFDKFTAIRILSQPSADPSDNKFDYLLNVDNTYLQSALKAQPKLATTLKMRFSVGMTLVALSLLHQEQFRQAEGRDSEDIPNDAIDVRERVAQTTAAMAPFLLPLVESVGDLDAEEDDAASESAGAAA